MWSIRLAMVANIFHDCIHMYRLFQKYCVFPVHCCPCNLCPQPILIGWPFFPTNGSLHGWKWRGGKILKWVRNKHNVFGTPVTCIMWQGVEDVVIAKMDSTMNEVKNVKVYSHSLEVLYDNMIYITDLFPQHSLSRSSNLKLVLYNLKALSLPEPSFFNKFYSFRFSEKMSKGEFTNF